MLGASPGTTRYLVHRLIGVRSYASQSQQGEVITSSAPGAAQLVAAYVPLSDLSEQAAIAAFQDALQRIRVALGPERPPSALLAFTSLSRPVASAALAAAAKQAAVEFHQSASPFAMAGCSSVRWGATSGRGARKPHVTLAALHCPGVEAHPFFSSTGHLPILPDLPGLLSGKRPPQFLVLGTAEDMTRQLRGRLANLFGKESVLVTCTGSIMLPQPRVGSFLESGIPGISNLTVPLSDSGSEPDRSSSGEGQGQAGVGKESGHRSRTRRPGASREPRGGSRTAAGSSGSSSNSGPDLSSSITTITIEGRSVAELTASLTANLTQLGQHLKELDSAVVSSDVVPLVYCGQEVHTQGCVGLMLRAAASAAPASASARVSVIASPGSSGSQGSDQAAITPAAAAQAIRVLFGSDRFASLHFPRAVWHHFQPPHTDAPSGQRVHEPQEGVWMRAPGVPGPGVWVTPASAPPPAAVGDRQPVSRPTAAQPLEAPGASTSLSQRPAAVGQVQDGLGAALPSTCTPHTWEPVDCMPPHLKVSIIRHSTRHPTSGREGRRPEAASPKAAGGWEAGGLAGRKASMAAMGALVGDVCGEGLPRPEIKGWMPRVPLFNLGQSFTVFTGEQTQLRILEPRYQWLVRQAVDQGGCFAISTSPGLGALAVVRSYYLSGDEFYVVVEGGPRCVFYSSRVAPVPGCFGLNAVDVLVLEDAVPAAGTVDAAELGSMAHAVTGALMDALARAAQEEQPQGRSSSSFATALHQSAASSSQSSADAGRSITEDVRRELQARHWSSEAVTVQRARKQHVCTQVLEAVSRRPGVAAAFSQYLATLIPVEHEVKQQWFKTWDPKERLKQQLNRLIAYPNLALAAVVQLKSSEDHPLRELLLQP